MNGNNEGPLWSDLHLLLAVARAGSFLAAGRALGLSTSTVSRRITALEASVGTLLVERSVGGAALTEAGNELVARIAAFEHEIGAALRDLSSAAGRLRGRIRLTLGDGFVGVAAETIEAFVSEHPDVRIDMLIENRLGDLAHREFDLAIRTVQGQEASLVYKKVGALSYRLYASPGYVSRLGIPVDRGELAQHRVVGFAQALAGTEQMVWLRQLGAGEPVLTVNTFGAMLESVHAGVGIAPLPDAMAEGLTPVLPQLASRPQAVYLAGHLAALKQPHIRAFADRISAALRMAFARR